MTSPEGGWRILRAVGTAPPVPWSNGAGTTRELVGYDESAALSPAGTARWRLSVAELERVGPFSPLPGVDRTFVLVGGDASLSVDGIVHRLRHGDILRFGGDQTAVLESLAARCHAVNLMVERADGAAAPRLTSGPIDPGARLAVALERTAEAARFDLLERAPDADPRPSAVLPAQAASLSFG